MHKPAKEIVADLMKDSLFVDWKENHAAAFLSHFFCPLSSSLEEKGSWEVGFYNPEGDKITIFVANENGFAIKPEDDVFKKKADKVEELKLDDVVLSFSEGRDVFKAKVGELFPNEQLGDGFVILQTLNGKTCWNFTMISRSLKFLNVKITADKGEVDSHQAVELMQK